MIIFGMKKILIALSILSFIGASAHADIYKYTDEKGVVCYTDIPLNKHSHLVIRTDGYARRDTAEAIPQKDFHSIVAEKANKYKIDPSLVRAVIKAESNGDPHAVSRKGAKGLMQLMPATADELRVRDPFDPEENIDGGTRYLKYLIERFKGDLTLALAAYNAGPEAVEKSGSAPHISETRNYVRRVLSIYSGKTPHIAPSYLATRPEAIYRIVKEDGSVLFTNSPIYRRQPGL